MRSTSSKITDSRVLGLLFLAARCNSSNSVSFIDVTLSYFPLRPRPCFWASAEAAILFAAFDALELLRTRAAFEATRFDVVLLCAIGVPQ